MRAPQFLLTLLLSLVAALLVDAQAYPPRLSIPGAVPVGRPQFRNEKVVRVRRPVALRSQNTLVPANIPPRIVEEPKPVTESSEDEAPDVFLPQLLREQQLAQAQQAQFQQTASAFFNGEPNGIHDAAPLLSGHSLLQQHHEEAFAAAAAAAALPTPTRFPDRTQIQSPSARPVFNDFGIGANIGSSQRFGLERSQPAPAAPAPPPPPPPQQQQQQQQQHRTIVRTRPVAREPRPQFESQSAPAPPPPAPRPRPKPIQSRPIIDQNQLQDEPREQQQSRRRPVAQTLRKWREENEDGSITWGYENDDGSFKEEIIGTDCVTKGTYGYIDPDGNKREYHYETGIKCDPNTRETEEELQDNGFINYEENKAVLPNGLEIDMSQLGKKKSKRPNANYRN